MNPPKPHLIISLPALLLLCACSHSGGTPTHIAVDQTPPAVVTGFNKEFPGLTITHTDSLAMPDGATHYELKFRDAANKYHRKTFTADGTLLDDKSNVILPKP